MNATDKLIARIETLSLTVALSEAALILKDEQNEDLYDKIDEQTNELEVLREQLSEAPSKWEMEDLRHQLDRQNERARSETENRDYYKRENNRLNETIHTLEAEIRQLRIPSEFRGKDHTEVAKAIIERDPDPTGIKKIHHIKQLREATGLGLKDAKDLIENTYVKLGTHVRDFQGTVMPKPQTLGELIKEKLGEQKSA